MVCASFSWPFHTRSTSTNHMWLSAWMTLPVNTYCAWSKPASGEMGWQEHACATPAPHIQQSADIRSPFKLFIGRPRQDSHEPAHPAFSVGPGQPAGFDVQHVHGSSGDAADFLPQPDQF